MDCKPHPSVDAFLEEQDRWRPEFEALREIILPSGLDEDVKWGKPTYSLDGQNVVLMHGFKDYAALLFMKGALMKDEEKVLIQQTENVQSARQIRFTSVDEIRRMDNMLKAYVDEAIQIEKSGAKVVKKTTADFAVAEEFQARLDGDAALKAAFEKLTPGRQRGYLLFFSGAKQAKTREARIDKCAPQIMAGKGLDD
ncbi:YdeI/OmpD-associated family protein [Asticcacaulis solisilvae]|uniref:YdeI/OmpD-associated family protein n=1 Tax=Asticcacaulis solisilvae TaxID=1217274 RepID=UPI003FD7BCFD